MSERFGDQTLVFVTVSETGAPGWGGLKEKARTETPVPGCHGRPFSTAESDGQTDVATAVWKWTVPPVAAALAARPGDEVKVDGVTWQIDGPVQPKRDIGGVHHVTVMCKRQAG